MEANLDEVAVGFGPHRVEYRCPRSAPCGAERLGFAYPAELLGVPLGVGPTMTALAHPRRLRAVSAQDRTPLALWIGTEIALAVLVSGAVVATVPLRRDIALPWPGLDPTVAVVGGLGFWLALGLIGSSRSRTNPGGTAMTFGMPFIVAGTILGGPFAGAVLGLVSELELREVREVPWYGVLANHAVSMLAAVFGGFAGDAIHGVIAGSSLAPEPIAFFVGAAVVSVVFAGVSIGLTIPMLALRNGIKIRQARRAYDARIRESVLAEAIVAWLLAVTYLAVGWWATIVCLALVALAWRATDAIEALRRDPMTGLLNDRGFMPRLEAAVDAARSGQRAAALLSLDLDGLWKVNQTWGEAVGDEYLKASAQRMLSSVRATDSVSRRANTGDEFRILLEDVLDEESALLVALRIKRAVGAPIHLRDSQHPEPIPAGTSIGLVWLDRGTDLSAADALALSNRRLVTSKARAGAPVSEGEGPTDAERRRRDRAKAIARNSEPVSESPRPARRRSDAASDDGASHRRSG